MQTIPCGAMNLFPGNRETIHRPIKPYGTSEDISAALFQTEMNNLKYPAMEPKPSPFLW